MGIWEATTELWQRRTDSHYAGLSKPWQHAFQWDDISTKSSRAASTLFQLIATQMVILADH